MAWFEPEHHIVEMNAQFFIDRFTNMCWSILTPERCLHWNRKELSITPGVPKSEAPTEDAVESLWLRYYSSIFNPARVKARTMQQSMPKKYWKNLPEAAVIPVLLQEAPPRVDTMMAKSEAQRTDDEEWHPAQPPATTSLRTLATAAAGCQACPLYKNATQTVFGEGPRTAEIVLLGEQPGDQEDRAGHPFVGPAGLLLNRALGDAGVDREKCYVTNVVKHFKWEPRGKRRLHQTPNSRDIAACRPWMEAEFAHPQTAPARLPRRDRGQGGLRPRDARHAIAREVPGVAVCQADAGDRASVLAAARAGRSGAGGELPALRGGSAADCGGVRPTGDVWNLLATPIT